MSVNIHYFLDRLFTADESVMRDIPGNTTHGLYTLSELVPGSGEPVLVKLRKRGSNENWGTFPADILFDDTPASECALAAMLTLRHYWTTYKFNGDGGVYTQEELDKWGRKHVVDMLNSDIKEVIDTLNAFRERLAVLGQEPDSLREKAKTIQQDIDKLRSSLHHNVQKLGCANANADLAEALSVNIMDVISDASKS